ncbi:MAG: aminotransferase class V-fold PLP-dependent enzyme, partial [Clostridia bacterium]|nr:aminotransferase class V-fold PLP-dependent enzyme [Clostridia bacterium]
MIYFDNAATSNPKPRIVTDEMMRALTQYNANPGRSGHDSAIEAARCVYNCRESIARLIDAESSDCVCFTFNCTDALNLAIKGSLRTGDHVISTMIEHNSVLRPLSGLAARRQISLTLLSPRPDGQIEPDDILRALRRNTKLIAVTHASNVTGAIQPVAAIGNLAEERGIPFLIDGAQALGGIPVSMQKLKCTFYAFPGHKSLLGPQGTGGLYIRRGVNINPLREGGTGTESDSMQQPADPPERYESGTLNLPG